MNTNNKNFEYRPRFSDEKQIRWTDDYITNQIQSHSTNLKRVWVCGPPMMNENFDKLFSKIEKHHVHFDRSVYEIM